MRLSSNLIQKLEDSAMSKETPKKPNSVERRIVFVGGASDPLDDAMKDFIVEWLVPSLVKKIHPGSLAGYSSR